MAIFSALWVARKFKLRASGSPVEHLRALMYSLLDFRAFLLKSAISAFHQCTGFLLSKVRGQRGILSSHGDFKYVLSASVEPTVGVWCFVRKSFRRT